MRSAAALILALSLNLPIEAQTTTTYQYDNLGRIRAVTQGGSSTVYYNYDRSNNRTQVSNDSGGWNSPPLAFDIIDAGIIDSVNGPYEYNFCYYPLNYSYDPDDHSLSVTHFNGSGHSGPSVCGQTSYSDTYNYTVSDGYGGSDTANIYITIIDISGG